MPPSLSMIVLLVLLLSHIQSKFLVTLTQEMNVMTINFLLDWPIMVTAILRLPSRSPWFESQEHHPSFYYSLLYYICHCIDKRMKIKKEVGFGPFFKKILANARKSLTQLNLLEELYSLGDEFCKKGQ